MSADCYTLEDIQEANRVTAEKLASRDPALIKEAEDSLNAFTRYKMREEGFTRRIMPPQTITNEELDRQVSTDKPVKVFDMEPDSPAAISAPFASLTSNVYIRGPRYMVSIARILSPKFTKDVDELRTWIMDIRQVLSDNAIKDMLAEEDGKFITMINTAMCGVGLTVPTSGTIQHKAIAGGMTRDGLWDAMKVMPSTPSRLETHTVLVNNITIKDVCKFGRTEMGGDMAQDVMKNGWTDQNFMGKRWLVTIKQDLVANNRLYHFADPKFLGKHLMLEDTTMYVRREAYFLEFFSYQSSGLTVANTNGLAITDHS